MSDFMIQVNERSQDMNDFSCIICYSTFEKFPGLECGHYVCQSCISQSILSARSNVKLTFGHLFCPLKCGSSIATIAITDGDIKQLLARQLELKNEVDTLGLARVREDELLPEETPEVELKEKAGRIYNYYECQKCSQVFFGGTAQCDAAGAAAQSEPILCGKCSNSGRKSSCLEHGDENIEWKCQFCCGKSPATFLCGGADYYCSKCHLNPGQITPCTPSDCIFDGNHPPAAGIPGFKAPRYALGCIICNDIEGQVGSRSSKVMASTTSYKLKRYDGKTMCTAASIDFENGDKYRGRTHGLKDGKGLLILADGTEFRGSFKDDKLEGYVEAKYPDKSIYKGNFEQGLKNGQGELWFHKSIVGLTNYTGRSVSKSMHV